MEDGFLLHQAMLQHFTVGAKVRALQAQRFLGLMVSTTAVIQHARLKMQSLQAWYLALFTLFWTPPPSKLLMVTVELAEQLTWWSLQPKLLIGKPFGPLTPTIQITTEVSPTG